MPPALLVGDHRYAGLLRRSRILVDALITAKESERPVCPALSPDNPRIAYLKVDLHRYAPVQVGVTDLANTLRLKLPNQLVDLRGVGVVRPADDHPLHLLIH